jgi:hypothetical protein
LFRFVGIVVFARETAARKFVSMESGINTNYHDLNGRPQDSISENRVLQQILGLNRYKVTG